VANSYLRLCQNTFFKNLDKKDKSSNLFSNNFFCWM